MASTYLSKTFNSGNRKTFTWSGWLKVSNPDLPDTGIFSFYEDDNNFGKIGIQGDNNQFAMYSRTSGTFNVNIQSSAVARDPNGWYHIVWSVDTTQATESNRVKLYINGTLQTSFVSSNYPSQNEDLEYNTTNPNYIGAWKTSGQFFDGSMAHVHFIDGTAYDASTFGETDSTTGIWKPKTAPSVTYGNNGFFLKFENSAAFGTDSSGNSNTFSVNGTMTQTIDTPSNVFATLNPLNQTTSNNFVLSNGNTTTITSGDASAMYYGGSSTLGASSGKWYCEFKSTSNGGNVLSGISSNPSEDARLNNYIGEGSYAYGYYAAGTSWNNNSSSSYGDTYTDNDIIGIAMDLDNSKLYFSKNGVWQNSGDPTSGATGTGAISITANETYFFSFGDQSSTPKSTINTNFGNGYFGTTAVSSAQNPDDGIGIFEYDVPAGYRALNTKSINAEEYN